MIRIEVKWPCPIMKCWRLYAVLADILGEYKFRTFLFLMFFGTAGSIKRFLHKFTRPSPLLPSSLPLPCFSPRGVECWIEV